MYGSIYRPPHVNNQMALFSRLELIPYNKMICLPFSLLSIEIRIMFAATLIVITIIEGEDISP